CQEVPWGEMVGIVETRRREAKCRFVEESTRKPRKILLGPNSRLRISWMRKIGRESQTPSRSRHNWLALKTEFNPEVQLPHRSVPVELLNHAAVRTIDA